MRSRPELLLTSELLELLNSGDAPRAWDQLAWEQSQLRLPVSVLTWRLVHMGNGSREGHLPVLAVGDTRLSLVSCSGQGELLSLWQLCSSPSHDHVSRLKDVP